jgi:hypothetical protein
MVAVMLERINDATDDDHGRHSGDDGMLVCEISNVVSAGLESGATGEKDGEHEARET